MPPTSLGLSIHNLACGLRIVQLGRGGRWGGEGVGVGVACRGATCGRGVSRGTGSGRGVGDSLPLVLALEGGRGFARSMAAGGGQGLRDSSACAWEVT